MPVTLIKKISFALILFAVYSCSKTSTTPATTPPPTTPVAQDTLNSWLKSSMVSSGLQDIWFNDASNGILAADTGILISANGGNTWATVPNTDTLYTFNIQFLDGQHGFAQGDHQLGITADGGKTWVTKPLLSYTYYSQFITATVGFNYNRVSGIYSTHDQGNTWTPSLAPATVLLNYPFYFLDSLKGFTMMDGNFSQTADGGASWQLVASNVTSPSFFSYYKMQFFDTLNGYCGTPVGLLKTGDGGKTWTNCLPASPSIIIPEFIDVNNGYCLIGHAIYKTTNGGGTWTTSCALVSDTFSGMHFLDMNTGWACTFGGYVLSLKL